MLYFLYRAKFVALFLAIILLLPAQGFCQSNIFIGQTQSAPTLNLLPVSQPISHASLKGIKVNPDNPFDIEFIIDTNNDKHIDKGEAQVLVNYFFAGLTLPEKDLWVNLSPYEENRIIPDTTVTTQLGEGLLSQDYLLKQLAASLTYPEQEPGKSYWNNMNNVGANNHSPVHQNFNKIWITPDTAKVYENGNSAFITESSLKVLTEEDYLAVQNNGRFDTSRSLSVPPGAGRIETNGTLSDRSVNAFKQYILPQIIQQVNHGEHFSQLRQIYNALILGVWFKNKLKDSIYKNYISQSKTKGIDTADQQAKEKIYQQYLNAFKQGVYNYVKKESVGANNHSPVMMGTKITRCAYFSGGVELGGVAGVYTTITKPPQGHVRAVLARARVAIYNAVQNLNPAKLSASRAITSYSANLSVEEYIDKAALDGIIGLYDRVVKSGASMRRDIEVYETGIVIHFDDGQDVNIVFSSEKPLPEVAQVFRGKFKNDFGWNRNFDAGDVARSLLSMLSNSKKYDFDVPKIVDEIVSFLYQRGQAERSGSGGSSTPPGKAGLSPGVTGQGQVAPALEYLPQARPAQPSRLPMEYHPEVRRSALSKEKTDPPPPLSVATKTKLGALGISPTKVVGGLLMPKGVVELLGELFGERIRLSPTANQGDPNIAAMQEAWPINSRYIDDCVGELESFLMQVKKGTYKGGAIGRWGYDDIKYDRIRGKLILENPWRIEKTDNTVEPEFAKFDKRIPGNVNRPDIEIDVTPATSEDGVDFAGNDVKIVFLEDNGENENRAGFWRLGGIGDFRVPGVIFIRRSLWEKADIDQKQELYGHEYLHYHGFSHKEAVSKQHKGGLTPLIKDQFQQDKKTTAVSTLLKIR